MATWFDQELPEAWPAQDQSNQSLSFNGPGPEPSTSASMLGGIDESASNSSGSNASNPTMFQPTVAIQEGNSGAEQQWRKALRPDPRVPQLESMFRASGLSSQDSEREQQRQPSQRLNRVSGSDGDNLVNETYNSFDSLSSQDISDTLPPDHPIDRRAFANVLGTPNTYVNVKLSELMAGMDMTQGDQSLSPPKSEMKRPHSISDRSDRSDRSARSGRSLSSNHTFDTFGELSSFRSHTRASGSSKPLSAAERIKPISVPPLPQMDTANMSATTANQTIDRTDHDPERALRLKAEGNRILEKLPERYPRRFSSRLTEEVVRDTTSLDELEEKLTKSAQLDLSSSAANSTNLGRRTSANGNTLDSFLSTSASSRQRATEVQSLGIAAPDYEPETSASHLDLDLQPSALRESMMLQTDASSSSDLYRKPARFAPSQRYASTSSHAAHTSSPDGVYLSSRSASSDISHSNQQIAKTDSVGRAPASVGSNPRDHEFGTTKARKAGLRNKVSGTSTASYVPEVKYSWQSPVINNDPLVHGRSEFSATHSNNRENDSLNFRFDVGRAFEPTPVSILPNEQGSSGSHGLPLYPREVEPSPSLKRLPVLESSIMAKDLSYSGSYDKLAKTLRGISLECDFLDINNRDLEQLKGLDKFMPNLTALSASNNHISNLEGLPTRLIYLDISHNLIGPYCTFPTAFVTTLDVSGNKLRDLRPLANLRAITNLDASENELEDLRWLDFPALTTLNVARNKLRSLDIQSDQLIDLDASNNQISAVRFNTPQLQVLRLDNNCLVSLDPVPSVRQLYIEYNGVTVDFTGWKAIEKLSYDGNSTAKDFKDISPRQITWVPPKDAGVIKGFEPAALMGALDIRLSGRLGSYLVQASGRFLVQHLDLMSCSLHHLPASFPDSFPNLISLNLAGNQLSDDVAKVLGRVRGLERLSLFGNKLQVYKNVVRSLRPLSATLEVLDLRESDVAGKSYAKILSEGGGSLPESFKETVLGFLPHLAWLDGEIIRQLDHQDAGEFSLLYGGLGNPSVQSGPTFKPHSSLPSSGMASSRPSSGGSRISNVDISLPDISYLSTSDRSLAAKTRAHSTPSSDRAQGTRSSLESLRPSSMEVSQKTGSRGSQKSHASSSSSAYVETRQVIEHRLSRTILRARNVDLLRALIVQEMA